MNNPVMSAENLCMSFGPIKAVQNASFEIGQGEVVGLLGPNGAGKTTTMRILTTYLTPSSGSVKIFGFNINAKPIQARKKIGYLPEIAPLYLEMEVHEYLSFVGKSRGLYGKNLKQNLSSIQESCQIKPVWKQPIYELSKGYRQRVGLAQALVHDPEILILDEPTSGLDPLQILGIRDLIKELSKTKTILFSTHILQEASAVTNRILIIHNGKLIADGNMNELQNKTKKIIKIDVIVQANKTAVEDALLQSQLFKDSEIKSTENSFTHFTVESLHNESLWVDLDKLIKSKKWPLKKFTEYTPTLEDSFIELTKQSEIEKDDLS